jgi:hypothetical protein
VGWLHHQFSESLGINPLIIVISKHAKRKFWCNTKCHHNKHRQEQQLGGKIDNIYWTQGPSHQPSAEKVVRGSP